ncbi:MAG: S1 family peptidase, partial [Aeoliella sp.]
MRLVVYAATLALLCNAESVRAQFLRPVTVTQPHPAVVRVVVPEQEGTAYGSGTLIDVRDDFGLVLTNWHVVRDAAGAIDVVFPSGFRSQARSLKVDSEWDLAALVIWRPPCEPVPLATRAPRPGDRLTICGYGQGDYRAVSGRCTQFYSPRLDLPRELVELDVEARQGDSGGPIFNDRGELAGVLFGAG